MSKINGNLKGTDMLKGQNEVMLESWKRLSELLKGKSAVDLDGDQLSIPDLVAVSRFGVKASMDRLEPDTVAKINESVQFLREQLEKGESVYGVNTGFGGSANTSTNAVKTLQLALLQMQHSAVLPLSRETDQSVNPVPQSNESDGESIATLSMPESWVRGAMLVRCNSLLRGHSAVRLEVISRLLKMLEHDLVPLVPLRGSISASGDLCPLSYIAGAMEGNPDIKVWSGKPGFRTLVPSDEALRSIGLAPIQYGPKECLGLLNGTAFSVAVASLAQHQADTLIVLAQIMTAMGVEALHGTVEIFAPLIAATRPHPGQVQVARNIQAFLRGSKLARSGEKECLSGLRQDRYALRTSSQWLGPVMEDVALARRQLEVELNSTTDNPLIDAVNKQIHHGGNFQAMSVTSSTEKTRLSLEKVGKMLFAQSSEVLDNTRAHGLPPNLAVDEPSLSYSMKGVDINMASYMSELSYVANPVSTHVLSAEMNNQAVNSLALISARYTHTAVDLVSLMSAAYLYCLCQALDLRAMDARFVATLRPKIEDLTTRTVGAHIPQAKIAQLHVALWAAFGSSLAATTALDSDERFDIVALSAQHLLIDAFSDSGSAAALALVTGWTAYIASVARDTFVANRISYLEAPNATPYLSVASVRMYSLVRNELGVPMHRGIVDHPTLKVVDATTAMGKGEEKHVNTGTQISRIYAALRGGRLTGPIMECLEDVAGSARFERAKL